MRETGVLIVGATALACGLAVRLGKGCTVVERGWGAGAEFAEAMRADPIDPGKVRAPQTEALMEELSDRNAISRRGEPHIPAFAGAFAGRFRASGCRVLLGTCVAGIERRERGFLVTVFQPQEGYSEILAGQVIDTLPQDFMDCRKTFSLMLTDGDPDIGSGSDPFLLHGRFAGESILTFSVPRTCTLPQAQRMADEWLTAHRELLRGAKAVSPALAFGYRFDSAVDVTRDGVRYVPSASFSDAVSAFEGGEMLCLS